MDAARRARLGQKWSCFSCGRKFYDLNREEPICPRCETDQRNAPPPEKRIGGKKATSDPSPALGDEEELAPDDLELGIDEVEDIDLNEADLGDDTEVAKGKPAG